MRSLANRLLRRLSMTLVISSILFGGSLSADEPHASASGVASNSAVRGPLDGNRFATNAESLWIGEKKYGAFWQVEFAEPRTIGSILQINSDDEFRLRNAPRNYAWQMSQDGTSWTTLPETMIRKETRLFRIHRLKAPVTTRYLRLMVHLAYGSAPAVREVEFYPTVDAAIPFAPWIVAVSSIEDPEDVNVAMPFIRLARQCSGWEKVPAQHLWHGDFDPDFVSTEPRPMCAFFSGSFLEWCQRSREPWRGVQAVLKSRQLPMWGACGGAQVLAILEEVGVDKPWDCPRCRKPGAPLAPIYSHIGHTGDSPCGDYSKCIGERGKHKLKLERTDPAFAGVPEIFELHESHIGQIDYVPKGWQRLVTKGPGSHTVNQCLKVDGSPIYAAQFHMETFQETSETSQRIMGNFLQIARDWKNDSPPTPLGNRKRLLWDESLFERSQGLRFEMHRPRRTGERNLVADKPWESWQMGGMSSLLHENGKFRLWYGVSHGIRNGEEYAVAYAESQDGIRWTKPELGLVEYDKSTKNNLVVPFNSVVGQVFVEPNAPSAQRYKMLVAIYPPDPKVKRYLTLLSSPDGLRWTKPDRNVVPDGEFALDTQSQAFFDRDRESYVLFTRMGPWRQIGRSESKDPFVFPPPVNVMRPEKPEQADYYQAGVTKYEEAANAYFGLVPIFFHPGDAQGNPVDGHPSLTVTYGQNPITVVAPDTLDLHLFTSNDSIHWTHRGAHEPFIGLGVDGSFDSRSLYPGVGYAVVGSEIWLYYSAYNCTHIGSLDGAKPFEKYLGAITRATLRLDGFVSANAGHDGAEIVTKPLTFTGDRLDLNVDCSAGGHVNVELQSVDGEPLPGFTLTDCDRIYHNHVRKTVTWNGKSDLTSLVGQPVRLRFQMRDCKLYALQFAAGARP